MNTATMEREGRIVCDRGAPLVSAARFSIGHLMALVAASAALTALFLELRGPNALLSGPNGVGEHGGAVALTACLIVVGIATAALRRSRFYEAVLGTGLAAGSMALFGGVRGTPIAAYWGPFFLVAFLAVPLWLRRCFGSDAEGLHGWPRRLVMAGRTGLNVSFTVMGLTICLMMTEMVGALLPSPPTPMTLPTGPFPSPGMVIPVSTAFVVPPPLPPEPSPVALPGPALPDFAPPPPSVTLDDPSPKTTR